jgi:hypothetical protein
MHKGGDDYSNRDYYGPLGRHRWRWRQVSPKGDKIYLSPIIARSIETNRLCRVAILQVSSGMRRPLLSGGIWLCEADLRRRGIRVSGQSAIVRLHASKDAAQSRAPLKRVEFLSGAPYTAKVCFDFQRGGARILYYDVV